MKGHASGAGCNCLIDTLRQKLPGSIDASIIPDVRAELENRHRDTETHIDPGEYLDLDFSLEIIDLLGAFSRESRVPQAWSDQFQVICVDLTYIGHGDCLPREASSAKRLALHIARVATNHFEPLSRIYYPPPIRSSFVF